MDGRVAISIILFIFLIFMFVLGLNEDKKQREKLCKLLKKNYSNFKIYYFKSSHYKDYFNKNKHDFFIDDITASDLDLDTLFDSLNHTYSIPGEQYLYYLLRNPSFDEEFLKSFDKDVRFLEDKTNRNTLEKVLKEFYYLGKNKNLDVDNFFEKNSNIKSKYGFHFLCYLLYIVSIVLCFFKPGLGIIAFLVSILISILGYFREKTSLLDFIGPAFYVIRLMKIGLNINDIFKNVNNIPDEFKLKLDKVNELSVKLKNATRGSSYVFLSSAENKNLVSTILDYVNMFLHIDILLFYSVKKNILENKNVYLELFSLLGYIESAIAIGSYRNSLENWCNPVFDSSKANIVDLYHPLIKDAVKNDANFTNNILITGSNASGKSTYLKSLAINILLAESFYTVCAKSYDCSHFRIYTSMALKDNLLDGDSFFMAEIKSIKRIIDAMNDSPIKIVCFIDEILKGTNTVERIAASCQVTKYLNSHDVRCIFATHDMDMAKLLEDIVVNVHFKEEIINDDVTFTYKLLDGPSTSKNAIKLLKHLGYEENLTHNAELMADYYEKNKEWKMY